MLTSLTIKNYTIVDELELDFYAGMSAFTGETGAGKSIMIDALMLALGQRADFSSIRPQSNSCTITACFEFDDVCSIPKWLKEHDIPYDDNKIYLKRVITIDNRSKSYINGELFPLQKIKEIATFLVDIHGQHQHQSLRNHATHRMQLDEFSGADSLLEEIELAFNTCQNIKKSLSLLEINSNSLDKQALLEFQIEELTALDPQEIELLALNKEHHQLHNAKDFMLRAQTISELLREDDNLNILTSLSQVSSLLNELPQDDIKIQNLIELINSAIINCEEAANEIKQFWAGLSHNPERLNVIEERLGQLHRLARKYHVDLLKLPQVLSNLNKELHSFENLTKHKAELLQEYEKALQKYEFLALELSLLRRKHAPLLCKEITKAIQKLGMPHGYIEIEITPLDNMHVFGKDKVEYKVCTNPGMKADLLHKIASGGELSRISLAIEMITAQKASTPTLIFDEVDVGIGGATAALVGQMLKKLGQRLQVFCVTHQPQVAAYADQHFLVEKNSENCQTTSKITYLSVDQKIREIARMIGGVRITNKSLVHARELVDEVS